MWAYLLTGRGVLYGCEVLRRITFFWTVGSQPYALAALYWPEKFTGTQFFQRLSKPQGLVRPEGWYEIHWPHRYSNPRLPVFNIVPQPTTPHRALMRRNTKNKYFLPFFLLRFCGLCYVEKTAHSPQSQSWKPQILHIINRLGFVAETQCVSCEVRTCFLYPRRRHSSQSQAWNPQILHIINRLGFVAETQCVSCEVRTFFYIPEDGILLRSSMFIIYSPGTRLHVVTEEFWLR
jgi:hypothetical protein